MKENMAIIVSAQAMPRPDIRPEVRPLLSVRWMHNTATGPTVTDEARPTHMPLSSICKASRIISNLSARLLRSGSGNSPGASARLRNNSGKDTIFFPYNERIAEK